MILAGMPHMVTLVVKNNTNKSIEYVRFVYNLGEISVKLKNIKPNQNKITGVSTIYSVSDLKMIVNEINYEYLIKSEIHKGCFNQIEITINYVDSETCTFDIVEVDR